MKKYNVICELVCVTYDIGPSLSPFVARVVELIRQEPRVEHILTPMGSILEGDWNDILNLIDRIFRKFAPEFERLGITLKIDYRRSKKNRIRGKISSVEAELQKINGLR
ncbi:MAG: MTH1187 family thiamine-binding protein [Candidatus Cloacimonetes bacterium]|nr:MTH1187 family thiamine-binding protein [Candidatus Cloacimonadota bacterium]